MVVKDDHNYGCSVAVQSDGSLAVDCGHQDNTHLKDLKSKIEWDEHLAGVHKELGIPPRLPGYKATSKGLLFVRRFNKQTYRTQLTNFTARIVVDVEEDDGARNQPHPHD